MALAHATSAFDYNGKPSGKIGDYILWIFDSYTDIKFDLGVFSCVTFFIVAPPSAAYLLSGLFGFAKWEILLPEILNFLVYCLVKTFISFSGIVIIIMPWAYFEGWTKLTLTETFCASLAFLSFVGFSFIIMLIHLNQITIARLLLEKMPLSLSRRANRAHQLFTRNLK